MSILENVAFFLLTNITYRSLEEIDLKTPPSVSQLLIFCTMALAPATLEAVTISFSVACVPISQWQRTPQSRPRTDPPGERCMAISVVVAVGAVADPLIAAIRERMDRVKNGSRD